MDIVKIDQLSVAARAGALDASLASTQKFLENQELFAQTAISGLAGLQSIISETGIYGAALRSLGETSERIGAANIEAAKDPFVAGSASQTATVENGVRAGLQPKTNALAPGISAAKASAVTATNGTDAGTAERAAGVSAQAAADAVAAANAALANGDPSKVQSAYDAAVAAGAAALSAYNNAPASRKAAALAVLNASNQTIAAARSVLDLRNTPLGQLAGVTPDTSDLGNGYTLSTWGDTGYTTISDASGKGVIISPDGSVDSLDGTGNGWKFSNTSTFVLPGDTKVTVNPGNPANILVSRGVHAFTVENLRSGSTPVTSDYTTLNGRVVDRASNDGHIFVMNGNAGKWTSNGSVVGDEPGRESVATSPLTNELKLDPTDVEISPELRAFIDSQIGLGDLDYDGDGKLNNVELATISTNIASFVKSIQESYEQLLSNLATANNALNDLNVMLELLRKQNDQTDQNRRDENAASSAELKLIERRLVDALLILRGTGAPGGIQGGIEGGAERVLQQLTNINQQGGVPVVGPTPAINQTPQFNGPATNSGASNSIETLGQPVNNNGADPIGDSLRRAGRLLSGGLGGGNLNILDFAPAGAPPSTAMLAALDELASALAGLATKLSGGGAAGAANPQSLSAGFGGILTVLAGLGLVDTLGLKDSTNVQDLLRALSQLFGASAGQPGGLGEVGVGNGPVAAASLLSFLGTLAQFGSALAAVAPEAGQTTPGQLEKASTGSLTPLSATAQQVLDVLSGQAEIGSAGASQSSGSTTFATGSLAELSRAAEQLRLVLAGLAALGSAGADQSTNNDGAKIPNSAELRLGLQSFLSALVAFGVFAMNSQQDAAAGNSAASGTAGVAGLQSANREAIETITDNFQTDPRLLKIIEENLSKALQTQQKQLSRASTLFEQSQKIVQTFVALIKQDDLVRDVVKSDELSDEQQAMFDDRMKELRKDWGIDWGGPADDGSAAAKSGLASRAVQSGMMV